MSTAKERLLLAVTKGNVAEPVVAVAWPAILSSPPLELPLESPLEPPSVSCVMLTTVISGKAVADMSPSEISASARFSTWPSKACERREEILEVVGPTTVDDEYGSKIGKVVGRGTSPGDVKSRVTSIMTAANGRLTVDEALQTNVSKTVSA